MCLCGVFEREGESVCVSAKIDFLSLYLSLLQPYCSSLSDLHTLHHCLLVRELGCLCICQLRQLWLRSCLCTWAPVTLGSVCSIIWTLCEKHTVEAMSFTVSVTSLPFCPNYDTQSQHPLGFRPAHWFLVSMTYFGGRVEKLGLVHFTVHLCSSPACKGWSSLFFYQRSGFLSVITHWHPLCWHLLSRSNL